MFAQADEVHVSVAFTADKAKAEMLAEDWQKVAPVKIAGLRLAIEAKISFRVGISSTATHSHPEDALSGAGFVPSGSATRRSGCFLLKTAGTFWTITCRHVLKIISAVLDMLSRQGRRVEFTGGLQAARLTDWHVELFARIKPRPVCFFAFDPGTNSRRCESRREKCWLPDSRLPRTIPELSF